jgi:hypothetical protein
MYLRKSTRLTPQRLDAARRNAQRSTGPRSEAGKERMKMNALQHGCDAAPENEAAVMRALGEDPLEYAALQRELATAYGPGGALWDQQLADLTKLYWRRNRIERMETGLMRRALQAVEERQRARRKEIAACTFDASRAGAMDIELADPTDPSVRLRLLLSLLGVLREQVRQRVFRPDHWTQIEPYYEDEVGWRPARFRHLLWLFNERADTEKQGEKEYHDFVSEFFGGGEEAVEAHYQELLTLLGEEIADVEEEFKHQVGAQEERDAIERDACLAPAGETWEMLLRQEASLDRSIDRKVRIILTMRKEHARECRGGSRTAQPEASPPGNESNERAAEELSKLVGLEAGADTPPSVCDSGQDGQTQPSLRETQTPKGGGLRQPARATETESPKEENAAKTSKSPEQSQNVVENKGSAVEGVRA